MAQMSPSQPAPSSTMRLPNFPLIRTEHLDEAVSFQSSLTAPFTATQTDRRKRFRWEANRIVVGSIGIVASEYGAATRAEAPDVPEQYTLLQPLAVGGRATQPGRTTDLVPGRTAVLTSTGLPAGFELGTGYRGFVAQIPAAAVRGVFAALAGSSPLAPLRFEHSVDAQAAGSEAVRLLEFIVGEGERDVNLLRWPLVEQRLAEAFICALLLGVPHNYSHLLQPAERAEPAYVRRAEEFLAANAHKHLGVADIARAAGIGVRALTLAFQKHRGSSPMDFLRQRRFELARERLLSPTATTVTEVALSCGFEHIGRFSVGYRARFGEGASETLRRARRRRGIQQ